MSRKKIFLILAELFFAAGFLIFQILDCVLMLHQVPDSFGHLTAVFDGSWDADSHSFSVNGPDPRLIFSEPGRPVSDLLLEVRPEGAEQIQVQVFYSRDGIFREEDSALRYVQPGDGAVRFVFPSDNWSQIRVDISQNADILQAELFCNQPLRLAEAFFASGALALPLFLIYRRKWLANRADRSIRPGHTGGLLRGIWGSRGGVFSSSGSSRILAYDVLRCMALIMVIAAHGLEADLAYTEGIADGKRAVMTVLSVFFLGCNVIYLMLSGALLLKPCKETAAAFYKKRLLRVVLPMGVYYLICLGFDGQLSFRIPEDLFYAIRDLLTGNTPAAPHYWLLFVLLSFYLLVPFLRSMTASLSYRRLTLLSAILFAGMIVERYFPLWGISLGISWYVASWAGTAVIGYWLVQPETRRFRGWILAAGSISFVIMAVISTHTQDYFSWTSNYTPLNVLAMAGLFTALWNYSNILGRLRPLLELLSRYSYSILLIHWLILYDLVRGQWQLYTTSYMLLGGLGLTVAAVLIVGLATSFLTDHTIIFLLRKGMQRLFRG